MASQYLLNHKRFWENDEPIKLPGNNSIPIQHNDCIKTFLKCIQDEGLQKAYNRYGYKPQESCLSSSVVSAVHEDETMVDVIVVGAGMAGLSAAYELKKAGLSVKILEQTERYGGRVYTYGKESGLASGLYAEAGAMRIPCDADDQYEGQHYLTNGYIKNFSIPIKSFPNYEENAVSCIYGFREKTKIWCEKHFIKIWPNWKDGIKEELKGDITDIYKYYQETTDVVTGQLCTWLSNSKSVVDQVYAWDRWIKIWSRFTVESFLESNINVIKAKVSVEDQKDLDLVKLENLLPWSNDAVRGFSVFCYVPEMEQSLDHFLSFKLGKWSSGKMHCLKGGMHNLPKAFLKNEILSKDDIEYKKQVYEINYGYQEKYPLKDVVEVSCYSINDAPCVYKAKAVIITTPINILRQIRFKSKLDDIKSQLAIKKCVQAMGNVFNQHSTKIFLQTKERFWENEGIKGGFSKTNLPIGQIHYVTPENCKTKEGLLMIYTWTKEALLFGSMKEKVVKRKVVEQLEEIHPTFKEDMVTTFIVHAWNSLPSYQGAYGEVKTSHYESTRHLWEPMGNVHFAGERISFTRMWIQGALESGLKAAFQVYERHMERTWNHTFAKLI